MKISIKTPVLLVTLGVVALAAPVQTENNVAARQDNTFYPDCGAPICFDTRDVATQAAPVANLKDRKLAVVFGDKFAVNEKRQGNTFYPDCGAPICFDTPSFKASESGKRDIAADAAPVPMLETRAEEIAGPDNAPTTFYPDCGAPICF